MQLLKDAGYVDALCDLKTEEGVAVSGTFIGYSYDKFKSPKGKLSTQLDHIFVKVFDKNASYTTKSHVNLKKYNGNDNLSATTEAELLVGPDGEETRDEFVSDHAAGIADIKVIKN